MPDPYPVGGLPPEVAQKFVALSYKRSFRPGQEIFDSKSAPTAMYGILEGGVAVSLVDPRGRKAASVIFGPKQWFGEAPLLDAKARAFRAVAQKTSLIAVLPKAAFLQLIASDQSALLAVTQLVCGRYRQALSWGEQLLAGSRESRLAERLLAQGDAAMCFSQDDLAAQLGVSRATVNRQLQIWQKQGLVRLSYRRIEVLSIDELTKIRDSL